MRTVALVLGVTATVLVAVASGCGGSTGEPGDSGFSMETSSGGHGGSRGTGSRDGALNCDSMDADERCSGMDGGSKGSGEGGGSTGSGGSGGSGGSRGSGGTGGSGGSGGSAGSGGSPDAGGHDKGGLCALCKSDHDCMSGDYCIADYMSGNDYCAPGCPTGKCPPGLECDYYGYDIDDAGTYSVCYPPSDTCDGWDGGP
jgi:hypothetical protein